MKKVSVLFLAAIVLSLFAAVLAYAAPQTDSTPPDANLPVVVNASVAQKFEMTVSDDIINVAMDPETLPSWEHTVTVETRCNSNGTFTKQVTANNMTGGTAPTFTSSLVAAGAPARGQLSWDDGYSITVDWNTDPGAAYQATIMYTLVN